MGFPKSFRNLTINESQASKSQPLLLESTITSNGSRNQFFSLLQYMSLQINKCGIFPAQGDHVFPDQLDIDYHGNSIPHWFTNQSKDNHVKVDLPSDWCYDKFRGYALCVVYSFKKSFRKIGHNNTIKCDVKNFDGALLHARSWYIFLGVDLKGRCESDRIWLYYTIYKLNLEKAENFVTFSFSDNGYFKLKECGVRLVCDEDIQKGIDPSMIQDIPAPTQEGAFFELKAENRITRLTW